MLQVLEVTVTFTRQVAPVGVPVIVKLVELVVTLLVFCVKYGVALVESFCAFTSIVTPEVGMPSVTVTTKGKFGPGAGGSTVPLAGVVVTFKAASPHPLSLCFLHPNATAIRRSMAQPNTIVFFMRVKYRFIKIL